MYKQPFCNFLLAGVSLTEYGIVTPSPFASLELSNSEIQSMTSWTISQHLQDNGVEPAPSTNH